MKQAFHIFSKDVRYLWREVLLILLLTVMSVYRVISRPETGNPFGELLVVASCWAVARLIQAEPLPGNRQFWLTRPYSRSALFGSKLLFILILVTVPLTIVQIAILSAYGFPVWEILPGLFWTQAAFWALLLLPLAALAAVLPGIVPVILTAFAIAVANIAYRIYFPVAPFGIGSDLGPLDWVKDSFAAIAGLCLAGIVLWAQYRRRATTFSRAVLILGGVSTVAVCLTLPWPLAFAIQKEFIPASPGSLADWSSLRVNSALPDWTPRKYLNEIEVISVHLPFAIEGVPAGLDVQADAVELEFRWSDGRRWKNREPDLVALSRRIGEPNVFDGAWLLGRSLLAAERGAPLDIRGSAYITVLGNARSRTVPLRDKPVAVMEGLQCYQTVLPLSVACLAPFHWPRGAVTAGFGGKDVRPLGHLVSYSPFPAGLNLDPNPIAGRSISGSPPLDSSEVTITIKEPVAHVRRAFELRGVRVPDFPATR